MLGDIKYQPITFSVPSSGAQVTVEADTDKLYEHCTGIFVSIPDEDIGGMTSSTFSRMDLGGKELFPDGYEVKMLNTSRDVPPDERYTVFDHPAKGARFKTKYTDSTFAGAYPYSVTIYLRLENK